METIKWWSMMMLLFIIVLMHMKKSLVHAEFQFNTIDSTYQVDSKTFRYTLNCGVNNSVTFQGKIVNTDTVVDAEIRCGFPVYYYQLNLAGYIPIETATVEVGNCIQQSVPDVFFDINSENGEKSKRSLELDMANYWNDSDDKRYARDSQAGNATDTELLQLPLSYYDLEIMEEEGASKKMHQRKKRDFKCDVINNIPLLNIFTSGSCPTSETVNQLNQIHARSEKITDGAQLLSNTAQQISDNIQQTNQLLQQCNQQTNAAFQNLQSFVKDQMSQVYDNANQKMQFASQQLNSIIQDQSQRVSSLINATNQQLSQTDFSYIQNQVALTYVKMLNISEDQMHTEYSFLNSLLKSIDELKYKDSRMSKTLDDFYELLLQLQYHQYGYGNLARNYHDALSDVLHKGYTVFLKTYGIAPKSNDSSFLIIDSQADIQNLYCGNQAYLISYASEAHWYIKNPSDGRPLNCKIKFATGSAVGTATINGSVFSMLPDGEDPILDLRKKTVLLELSTVYGSNQTVWGSTLGEGLVTSRRYALFDGMMYKSKCDTGRFGAYINQWVPVYRLSFARSYVENASISYNLPNSNQQVTVNDIQSAQWLDSNQGSLPKNNDLFVFHRNESYQEGRNSSDNKVYNIYSPPSQMLQMDGPTSTRIGKLGYFSWHTVPSDPVNGPTRMGLLILMRWLFLCHFTNNGL
jgi:hypothetical protein